MSVPPAECSLNDMFPFMLDFVWRFVVGCPRGREFAFVPVNETKLDKKPPTGDLTYPDMSYQDELRQCASSCPCP